MIRDTRMGMPEETQQIGQPVATQPMPTIAPPAAPPSTAGTGYAPGINTPATILRKMYDAAVKQQGVDHLAAHDPTTLLLYQVHGQLTPEQAKWASQQAAQAFQTTGQPMGDYDLDQLLVKARSIGSQTDPAWDLGNKIRAANEQATKDFGGQLAPNDPRLIQRYRAAGTAAGTTLSDQQAQAIGQQDADYYRTTGQAIPDAAIDVYGGALTNRMIPMGHQVNPGVWDSLGPVGQGLALSAVEKKGLDPTEYQRQINAARPVGRARPSSGVDYSGLGTGIMG